MKLKQAPVICHQFDPAAPWLLAAGELCRRQYNCTSGTDQDKFALRKLAEDVWAINGPMGMHTDGTRKGFRVVGLVLVNDPGLVLYQDMAVHQLPLGTVYHIDGRAKHAALAQGMRTTGLFGFMAWDVDKHSDLADLIGCMPDAMGAYSRGERRVDVALDHLS